MDFGNLSIVHFGFLIDVVWNFEDVLISRVSKFGVLKSLVKF
jgi:hypothetical protein